MYIKEYYVEKWKTNTSANKLNKWFGVGVSREGGDNNEYFEYHTIEFYGLTNYKINPYFKVKKLLTDNKYEKIDQNLNLDTFLHYKEVDNFDDKYDETVKKLDSLEKFRPIQWKSWLLEENYGKIFNIPDTEKTYTNYEPYKILLSKHRQKDESGNDEEYIGNIVDFKDGNIVKIIIHTYFKFKVSEREQIMYGVDEKELKKKWLFMTDYYVSIVNKNTHYNKKYFYRNERYGDPNDPKVYERNFNL